MRSIIIFCLLTAIFGASAYGQESGTKISELPAEFANLEWQDSDQLLENEIIRRRLVKLLGAKEYDSFMESFETRDVISKRGNFLFSSGCMIHACTHLESAIAVDLANNAIHAAIYDETRKTRYFNEKGSKTPESITEWVLRLSSLKEH